MFLCIFMVRQESEGIGTEQVLLESDRRGARHPKAETGHTRLLSSLTHLLGFSSVASPELVVTLALLAWGRVQICLLLDVIRAQSKGSQHPEVGLSIPGP